MRAAEYTLYCTNLFFAYAWAGPIRCRNSAIHSHLFACGMCQKGVAKQCYDFAPLTFLMKPEVYQHVSETTNHLHQL